MSLCRCYLKEQSNSVACMHEPNCTVSKKMVEFWNLCVEYNNEETWLDRRFL